MASLAADEKDFTLHAAQIEVGEFDELWAGVDRLIDRAPDLDALAAHRLHLLAADRWARLGRPVPEALHADRRGAAYLSLVVGILLDKIRDACDGPIVLFKGPEAASYYPDPALRPFRDLDLLVPDAAAVQRDLLAAGFELTGDEKLYRDIHHLRPVVWPEMPFVIEVHERPKWVAGLPAPTVEELLEAAVPGASGVEGIQTLSPAHHSLVLAAHAWAHVPLRRLLDIVDVAAVSRGVEDGELRDLARAWGLGKLWRTTDAAVQALLYRGPMPVCTRTWARNLPLVRERSVLESHLERVFASFWALGVRGAVRQMAHATAQHFRPEPGESWRVKLGRSIRALRSPLSSVAAHDRAMEAHGLQAPSKEVSNDNSATTNGRSELARDRR
jgi:hypothetical protein